MALRHNQQLSVEELHAEAKTAFEEIVKEKRKEGARYSQRELGRELGVTSGAVSRA